MNIASRARFAAEGFVGRVIHPTGLPGHTQVYRALNFCRAVGLVFNRDLLAPAERLEP